MTLGSRAKTLHLAPAVNSLLSATVSSWSTVPGGPPAFPIAAAPVPAPIQRAAMEAELGTALKRRGSLYTGLPEALLQDLATAAQRHGLITAKETAAAFDKWMTVHRCGRRPAAPGGCAAPCAACAQPLLQPPLRSHSRRHPLTPAAGWASSRWARRTWPPGPLSLARPGRSRRAPATCSTASAWRSEPAGRLRLPPGPSLLAGGDGGCAVLRWTHLLHAGSPGRPICRPLSPALSSFALN